MIKYFSMFSGIGGFEHGIEQAVNHLRSLQQKSCKGPGECNSTKNELLQWECVGNSEVNRYANSVYRKHYPEHKNYGDASNIVPKLLPDFNLLVAGFPCQPFSVAGKRKGFNDTRGTLFFDISRILSYKRPRYLLLENVRGLLSHDSGKTFQRILGVLSELGYSIQWQILNSKNFGVPQNRERVYIIGYLGKTAGPQIFPIGESDTVLEDEKSQVSATVTATYWKGGKGTQIVNRLQQLNNHKSMGYRVYNPAGIAKTLASNAGGLGAKTGLYLVNSDEVLKKEDEELTLFPDEIIGNNIPNIEVNGQKYSIRRLTPKECERLQGFPDDWTKYGINKKGTTLVLSDTQRYRLLGNAVTTNVIQYIIEKFILSLGGKGGKD